MEKQSGGRALFMSMAHLDRNGVDRVCSGVPADIRERFRQEWVVYALRVPVAQVAALRGALASGHLLKLARKPSVVTPSDRVDAETQERLILLRYLAEDQPASQSIPEESNFSKTYVRGGIAALVERLNDVLAGFPKNKISERLPQPLAAAQFTTYKLLLDYEYFSHSYILSQLLPAAVPVPRSFETTGHVLHLNLRDEHRPYRYLIGQVLREKIPGIQVVVNKAANVDGPYRIFAMEVLAAVPEYCTQVRVRENGCIFHLDMSRVYWNSRLETEHRRVIESISARHGYVAVAAANNQASATTRSINSLANIIVADAFAGVGPFAIPLAKRGFSVYANDLNPEAVSYLERNISANRLASERCQASCLDARSFLETLLRKQQLPVQYIIMNLPADALSYLDVLVGNVAATNPLPFVYCYCFGRGDDAQDELITRVNQVLDDAWQSRRKHAPSDGTLAEASRLEVSAMKPPVKQSRSEPFRFDPEKDQLGIRCVRHVAPEKYMFCVEFQLPERIARLGSESPHK
jgi:tRNA (guanine37-N1)-methyltransferase